MGVLARWFSHCQCAFHIEIPVHGNYHRPSHLFLVNVGSSVLLLSISRMQTPRRIGRLRLARLARHHNHTSRESAVQLCKQSLNGAVAWTVGSKDQSLWCQSCLGSLL